jgi:uncharacterized protein
VKTYLKFGIVWGITGILLVNSSLPTHSIAIAQSKRPIAQSSSTPQPAVAPTLQKLPLSAQITVNGRTILLEVARTSQEQQVGLMNRTELAADRGMLFVFSPPREVGFWMKNTLIPLDMLFIADGVVKHISANTPPCKTDPCPSYGPAAKTNIDSVIELRGGRAAELKLKVGDRVVVRNYSAKRLK